MQTNVHASLLLTLIALSLVSLAVLKRRAPTSRQFVIALLLSAMAMVAGAAASSHLCHEGYPRHQIIILGLCLLSVLTFMQSARWRKALGICVFAGLVGLAFHFSELVHAPGWTGNPNFEGVAPMILQSQRKAANKAAAGMGISDLIFSAGWIRDLPAEDPLREMFDKPPYPRRQVHAVWHSLFTGLYRYEYIAQDFWYPGGPLKDGLAALELRDRMEQP